MLGAAGGAAAVESGERAAGDALALRVTLPHIGLPNSPNGQTHDTLPWPMLADGRKDRRKITQVRAR